MSLELGPLVEFTNLIQLFNNFRIILQLLSYFNFLFAIHLQISIKMIRMKHLHISRQAEYFSNCLRGLYLNPFYFFLTLFCLGHNSNILEQSINDILITYLLSMSSDLLKKIEKSRASALEKGTVIKLRREDVDKTKLLGAKFTYSWYQTPAKVGIQIPYIVDKKEDLIVKFQEDRVTIDFPIKQKKEKYHLDLILFKPIVPARSKAFHRLDSIQIVLEKEKQSDNWLFLRRDGIGIPEAAPKQENLYPSSSRQKKNWDKIDKQIQGDILKHGQEYGQDTSMSFFKQIFAQGDQEKRKAMMKSFQTSGGTVLSTDWNDVSKKDYEGKDRPSPPKGQEWRKRQI